MTREEAIGKLQKQKAEYLEKWVDFSEVAEAYDMAIEALKQSPKLDGEWKECGTITIEGYKACLKECSKCHSVIAGFGNFCPVCGADMRKNNA